tara:strand:+ start:1242 stop:2108 length:867 start_codon:yes stop_codon:yes gene_type:complete
MTAYVANNNDARKDIPYNPITTKLLPNIMYTPDLLNLPREIRGLIYGYLTHDIVLDWGYRIFPFPLGGHSAVQIRVPDAPILNVLLSCTQIYDEYSQARHFKLPSISIDLSEDCMWRLMEGEPTNQARVFKVLERIGHVEFLVDSVACFGDAADAENLQELFVSAEALTQAISVFAPKLRTIKMGVQLYLPYVVIGAKVETDVRAASNMKTAWLHHLPSIFVGRFVLDSHSENMRLSSGSRDSSRGTFTPRDSSRDIWCNEGIALVHAEWRLRNAKEATAIWALESNR